MKVTKKTVSTRTSSKLFCIRNWQAWSTRTTIKASLMKTVLKTTTTNRSRIS